ncbi:hypothetical protein QLX08_000126 [Tetragonisca angustula]|uniref:Uncharacterized protein n=1 Tax=Tetragonisca angustula TaxID=166442 RepID=A0AAW1AKT4_9HYME
MATIKNSEPELMRSILNNMEVITTQLRKQEETQRTQGDALRKLLQSIKIMEDDRAEQAKELKNLGTQLGLIATTEETRSRNPTATEPEITDDESTISTAWNDPPGRNTGTPRRPMIINNLKVTDALLTVETLYGKDDIGVEEFIKSVKFARNRVND